MTNRVNPKPLSYIERSEQQWLEGTYPEWVDTLNGTLFDYYKDAIVRYKDGVAYISLVDDNTEEPTKGDKWARFDSFLGGSQGPGQETVPKLFVTEELGFKQRASVLQESSKSQDVTLNAPNGEIHLMDTFISAVGNAMFKMNNTSIAKEDALLLSIQAPSVNLQGHYSLTYTVGDGFAYITVRNMLGAAVSDALVINFKVIKG